MIGSFRWDARNSVSCGSRVSRLAVVSVVVLWAMAGRTFADGPGDNDPTQARPVPPPGIEVPQADRTELDDRLMELETDIQQLRERDDPRIDELLPDVEIFARAVDQALRFNGFFAPHDVENARLLLEEGRERAARLATGEAPWTRQTGLVVRGYRSRLDDTVQPYGLVVPETYDFDSAERHRCDIWFHGRGEKSLELQFIRQRMVQPGQYTPPETIVLHPFGRFCNAFKFAGEVDVLEALEHVESSYRIDEERISERGFSMGGAACWQFAVHYADRWFAANPGAGFSETPLFLKSFQGEELNPPWWEERLWRMYDCPLWVRNLLQCPTVAYSGEIDRQKQAADVMAEAFAGIGVDMVHIIGPQTAHAIHPQSKIEIEQRMQVLADLGRDDLPRRIDFTTYTLKYNRMDWVTVNALDEHWSESRVAASISPFGDAVQVNVDGVSDLTLELPAGSRQRLNGADVMTVEVRQGAAGGGVILPLDGETPGWKSDGSWVCRLSRVAAGQWRIGSTAVAEEGLRKRHNLQGPIDDAFMESFLFVAPGSSCANPRVDDWVESEMERAIAQWRQQMRGDARVKLDSEVTDDDIARHNLILWGDPRANQVLARILGDLPITWTADTLTCRDQTYPASDNVPVLIYPNPLNPERYVVLNSGFTYREYDYLNNARQTPKLPDWAVVDLKEPPGPRWPGRIVDAGFFDERWQIKGDE